MGLLVCHQENIITKYSWKRNDLRLHIMECLFCCLSVCIVHFFISPQHTVNSTNFGSEFSDIGCRDVTGTDTSVPGRYQILKMWVTYFLWYQKYWKHLSSHHWSWGLWFFCHWWVSEHNNPTSESDVKCKEHNKVKLSICGMVQVQQVANL